MIKGEGGRAKHPLPIKLRHRAETASVSKGERGSVPSKRCGARKPGKTTKGFVTLPK